MKSSAKRSLALLPAPVPASFGYNCIAHGIQAGYGAIDISPGVIGTEDGSLACRLSVPKHADAATAAWILTGGSAIL